MKKSVYIVLIVALLPLFSVAQALASHEGNNFYSNGDGIFASAFTGGKKKKKKVAAKKENNTNVKKEVKAESGKSQKIKGKEKKQKAEPTSYNLNFYAGPDLAFGFPIGRIRDSVNNGTGFNIRAEYFYTPNINLGLWTGFKSFKYDQVMVGKGHFSYIPIKLTGTYYFSEGDIKPYVNFGLGVYLVKQKYDAETWTMVRNPQTNRVDTLYEKKHLNNQETKFGLSPSAGVLVDLKNEFFINVNMSYEMILTDKKPSNILGINLGLLYKFGF